MTGQTKGQAALAGSRRVIYNADVVMFLRSMENENEFLLDIEKFREGDTDELVDILVRPTGMATFREREIQR